MAKVSREQLVAAVAEQKGMTKALVTEVLDAVTATIASEVSKGNDVRLGNVFGTFVAYTTKPTTKFNPSTKEPINIPAKRVIKFKPSAALKQSVDS